MGKMNGKFMINESIKNRNHPLIRAKIAPNLALQERDRQILIGVHKYRLLSREQVQALFGFHSLTRINVRLRKLFDAKFLDRIFLPAFWGSPKAYYCLGMRGIEIVAETTDNDILEIKKERRQILKVREMFLRHQIAVNDSMIIFELMAKKLPNFQPEMHIAKVEIHSSTLLTINSNFHKLFKPDGYVAFRYQDKIYTLFLEIDLGTESLKIIQQKIGTYFNFGFSGEYQQIFGHKYFRVLFICSSQERLKNIKKVIEQQTDKMFWLAEIDKISVETIFSSIWQRPKREGLFSLIS